MLVMAMYIVVTYLVRDVDPYFVLAVSLIIGLFSGYDDQIGDTLALSRAIVFYPFYLFGRCLRLNIETIDAVSRRPAAKATSFLLIAGWVFICFIKLRYAYALRPFFTGRNPFSASKIGVEGVWVRLLCYVITGFVVAAFILFMPEKRVPVISGVGTRTLQVYVLHLPVRNAVTSMIQVKAFLNTSGMETFHRVLYFLVPCAVALFLSSKLFNAPIDYYRKKWLYEEATQQNMS